MAIRTKLLKCLFYVPVFLILAAALGALALPQTANAALILQKPTYTGLNQGLVGYWSFDGKDISGTIAYDRSGQGNNGTLTNGPIAAKGKIGQALSFTGGQGLNGSVSLGQSLDIPGPVTICSWVYPRDVTSTQLILENAPNPYATFVRQYSLNINNDWTTELINNKQRLEFNWGSGSAETDTWYTSSGSFSVVNSWRHVCVERINANTVKFYIDSVEVSGTNDLVNSIPDATNITRFDIGANSTGGRALNGMLDDVRIYNRALSADEIKRLYRIGGTLHANTKINNDSLSKGLVGWWTFDGADMDSSKAYDKSGQGNTGTLTNGPTVVRGKLGQALSFDGSNDYVDLGTSNQINGDKTISTWINSTYAPDDCSGSVSSHATLGVSAWNSAGYIFWVSGGNVLWGDADSAELSWDGGATILCDGRWHHAVAIRRGAGGEIWIDGILRASKTTGFTDSTTNNGTRIGDYQGDVGAESGFLRGSQDDVRIYNRALSSDEIKRLYRVGATLHLNTQISNDTLSKGLVGWWTFDGADTDASKAYDKSVNNNTGTLTNGPTVVRGKLGQALSFDGSNDYVNIGTQTSLDLDTRHTVTAWVKTKALNIDQAIFTHGRASCCGTEYGLKINYNAIAPSYRFSLINDRYSAGAGELDGSTEIQPNQWYFVVNSWDGSIGKLYVNGALDVSAVITGTISEFSDTNGIGAAVGDSIINYSNADIDDVRVYNRALSADEIKRLYNAGR